MEKNKKLRKREKEKRCHFIWIKAIKKLFKSS